eukprot:CAMPEP_0202908186 /NCGR_PEP_ID=MMETSP1392-20130828/45169_1 /ASSEMBLY_ACC=CAM_ASM_000868 /TAXON_ID=225041 /ORGANISM="Chlamydomonas chlamydogama, Strain SAG 11-48b" /LENGTH=112 /DNA_ID=CAMNT_0049597383 /DNA_START=404 /DNA_END=739 /DNA_ORIENTATION=-
MGHHRNHALGPLQQPVAELLDALLKHIFRLQYHVLGVPPAPVVPPDVREVVKCVPAALELLTQLTWGPAHIRGQPHALTGQGLHQHWAIIVGKCQVCSLHGACQGGHHQDLW